MKHKALIFSILLTLSSITVGCGGTAAQTENNAVSQNEVDTDYSEYVTLGNYKGLSTGITLKEVTDEDIDKIVKETVDAAGGYFEEKDDADVKEGSQVEVTLKQVNTESEAEESSLTFKVGDENYPAEFSEGLMGLKKGESTTIALSEESGGSTFLFTVIKVLEPAEITDEFVKTLGIENVSTVKELRKDISKFIEKQNGEEYNTSLQSAASKLVIEDSKVSEIPEELLEEYKDIVNKKADTLLENAKAQAENEEEVTLADALNDQIRADGFVGTVDEYLDWYSEKNAREYMVYYAIAKKEGISLNSDEVYSMIATDWASSNGEYETLIDYINEYGKSQYEKALLSRKVIEFIADNTTEGLIKEEPDDSAAQDSSETSLEETDGKDGNE